jgi:hypothetical protein
MYSILIERRNVRRLGLIATALALAAAALVGAGSASALVPIPPEPGCSTTATYVGPCPAPAPECSTANAVAPCPARGPGCLTDAAGVATNAAGGPIHPVPSCALPRQAVSASADRYGYCSAAGDTATDGTPIRPGTFLNLLLGQPDGDPHYTGAKPAFFITGVGATCTLTASQASLAASSTVKVDHTGHPNELAFYILIG